MSIAKPFTFTANTYAKASEVNADFDIVYSQVNTNISAIAQNATDIDNLENNKANINGNTSQRFAVADAVTNGDAINKQTLFKAIGNTLDYISGLAISKDNGSPDDTIIVSAGSAYDSTKSIVLSLANSLSKQNTNQAANATYYVYIIGSSSGSQTDILISPNQVTPTLPTGYSLYRQIGYYTTNADSKIGTISYYGESVNTPKPQAVIVETFIDEIGGYATAGYRVWSDGYCEQWGFAGAAAGVYNTRSFLKPFKDTKISITTSQYNGSSTGVGGNEYFVIIGNPTTTEFGYMFGGGVGGAYWKACGYVA